MKNQEQSYSGKGQTTSLPQENPESDGQSTSQSTNPDSYDIWDFEKDWELKNNPPYRLSTPAQRAEEEGHIRTALTNWDVPIDDRELLAEANELEKELGVPIAIILDVFTQKAFDDELMECHHDPEQIKRFYQVFHLLTKFASIGIRRTIILSKSPSWNKK